MKNESSGLWHAICRGWPKSISGGDAFLFAMLALGCLLFIAASVSLHLGVASTATTLSKEIEELPFAIGQPPGTRAVLTGIVSDQTPEVSKGFVAFVEEDYRAGGKNQAPSGWEVSDSRRRPFRIDTTDGSMELAGPNYTFGPRVSETGKALLPDWDHDAARIKEPASGWDSARRYRGLVAGGPVTAIGTVTPDGKLDADFVVGLDLEELHARLEPVASGETSSFAYWLTAIGVLALVLVIVWFVREWRRSPN